MTLKHLLAGAAFAATLVGFTAANAFTNLGTETGTGFVGNLLASSFPGTFYLVASDGESSFDPFGAGFDTSDGLNFSGVGFTWIQAADSSWTSLGNQTWVLPASIPGCGSENEPTCEPVGHFTSTSFWSPGAIGTFVIYDSGGGISDVIRTFNGANGAELLFSSDPSLLPVPEPATWALMLVGLGGIGAAMRFRRRAAIAA
jgi:hypothetical protein